MSVFLKGKIAGEFKGTVWDRKRSLSPESEGSELGCSWRRNVSLGLWETEKWWPSPVSITLLETEME